MTNYNSLGNGLSCPFRFTSAQDFATANGTALVKSDVHELLGIVPGEVPWRPSLGTNLTRLRHRANTQALADLARIEVARALAQFEPRVRLKSVTSPPVTANSPSKLELNISYEVAGVTDTAKAFI